MISIAHIVNPVAVPPSSDLFVAQPITFETMRRARDAAVSDVDVSLYSAQYAEDRVAIPPDFTPTDDLERSVLEIEPPPTERKLPYVKDICDRLYAASPSDYLIYTNVDIAVQPNFYRGVGQLVERGFDAFALTRQNIADRFTSVDELPEMYRERGTGQRGPDCFVFHRELYPTFQLEGVFVGEPGIGRVILANLIRYGRQPGFFTDGELTFHIGNDGAWKQRLDSAGRVNLERSLEITKRLYEEVDEERRQLLQPHLAALERMLEIDPKASRPPSPGRAGTP